MAEQATKDGPTHFKGVKLHTMKTPRQRMAYLRKLVLRTKALPKEEFDEILKAMQEHDPDDVATQEDNLVVNLGIALLGTQHTRWYPFAWAALHWSALRDALDAAEDSLDSDNPDPEVQHQIRILELRIQHVQPYLFIPDAFVWGLEPQPFGSNDDMAAYVSRIAT